MKGDLLTTYFSRGDAVRRIILSPDASSTHLSPRKVDLTPGVLDEYSLDSSTSFDDPLTLTSDALGRIYVGEFGANQVHSPLS